MVADGLFQWCAICGARGTEHGIGNQKCGGPRWERWAKKAQVLAEDVHPHSSQGHQRMISGEVVWCNLCGTYGTHRGCGLAKPCPGPPRMGPGGGMWQRLRLLRANRHPKDKRWLPEAIPEARWSMQNNSAVSIAMAEARSRESTRAQKSGPSSASTLTTAPLSKLEMLRLRVRAKQIKAENRLSDNPGRSAVTGSSSASATSRFETLRQRIKNKELAARDVLHLPG